MYLSDGQSNLLKTTFQIFQDFWNWISILSYWITISNKVEVENSNFAEQGTRFQRFLFGFPTIFVTISSKNACFKKDNLRHCSMGFFTIYWRVILELLVLLLVFMITLKMGKKHLISTFKISVSHLLLNHVPYLLLKCHPWDKWNIKITSTIFTNYFPIWNSLAQPSA